MTPLGHVPRPMKTPREGAIGSCWRFDQDGFPVGTRYPHERSLGTP